MTLIRFLSTALIRLSLIYFVVIGIGPQLVALIYMGRSEPGMGMVVSMLPIVGAMYVTPVASLCLLIGLVGRRLAGRPQP